MLLFAFFFFFFRTSFFVFFFFFQAEDGIRDVAVTGVQTCALPISGGAAREHPRRALFRALHRRGHAPPDVEDHSSDLHRAVVPLGPAARRAQPADRKSVV